MAHATIPNRPVGSDPRAISAILANFDAITVQLNGNVDGTNIAPNAISAGHISQGSLRSFDGAVGANGFARGVFVAKLAADYTHNNTGDRVAFGAEDADINSWFNDSSGQRIYVPQEAGWYRFSWQLGATWGGMGDTHYLQSLFVKSGSGAGTRWGPAGRPTFGYCISAGTAIAYANGTTDGFFLQAFPSVLPCTMAASYTYFMGEFIGRA